MRHKLRPVLLLTLACMLNACGRDEPAPAPPAPDSATVGPVPGSDTTGGTQADSVNPATVQDTLTGAVGSTADTSTASLRAEIAALTTAITTLTRSNDSLRAEIARTIPPRAEADSSTAPPTGQALIEEAGEQVRNYGARSFWALVVLALTFFVVKALVSVLNTLSERSASRRLVFKRLVPIVRILLWMFAVFFTIRVVFDVDARGLLTATAAIGVAVGFAAQDILKNIFGGLVIVFDQPFQVGDKIQVGSSYGEVVSIGLRSTRIVTPDDSLVTVPNSQVVDSQVSNANSGALDCQVVTDLYLPGFVDEAKAKRIAFQAAASSKYVYLKKPIVVLVKDEFKETFLTHLKVKAYVLDARYEFAFMSDVTERARAEFRQEGLLRPMHGTRAWVDLSATDHPDRDGRAFADAGES